MYQRVGEARAPDRLVTAVWAVAFALTFGIGLAVNVIVDRLLV
jgi:hypothetical protein